ncbi:MAG: flagellar basal body L-ring protein FlgH [Planctomycetes bacterium]|nr:flagellar basal body L-ring protein FlgH [Planctomycetota bacterium]
MNLKPLVLSLSLSLPAAADGLLGDETASPYAPERPTYAVNDIIKIKVNELSTAEAKAGTDIERETRLIAALQDYVQLTAKGGGLPDLKPGLAGGDLRVNGRVQYERDNDGETSGSSKVVFTVAAKVIEVLDNGNLVLAARKEVQVNDETVTMTVTGEVAPADVAADRTVGTDKVADVKIRRTGDGTVNDAQKRGFLSWLLEVLWPF